MSCQRVVFQPCHLETRFSDRGQESLDAYSGQLVRLIEQQCMKLFSSYSPRFIMGSKIAPCAFCLDMYDVIVSGHLEALI